MMWQSWPASSVKWSETGASLPPKPWKLSAVGEAMMKMATQNQYPTNYGGKATARFVDQYMQDWNRELDEKIIRYLEGRE